ncbi:hypothetical protein ACO0LB_17885 [Undibacterium sp. SXout7W]|uniref:hypothetical protein n=1 Tax=Undibacterium sp. SXout7W TaxID=3413049 RepID=UPI003BF1DFCE
MNNVQKDTTASQSSAMKGLKKHEKIAQIGVALLITLLGIGGFGWLFEVADGRARRQFIDQYYDDAAEVVCIGFTASVSDNRPATKSIMESVGNGMLKYDPKFKGVKIVALDDERFTFKVFDRDLLMQSSQLATPKLVDLLESRNLSRSILANYQPSMDKETCADFIAISQQKVFKNDIRHNPLLDMNKRPAWE